MMNTIEIRLAKKEDAQFIALLGMNNIYGNIWTFFLEIILGFIDHLHY